MSRPIRVREFALMSSVVSRCGALILLKPGFSGGRATALPFSEAVKRLFMVSLVRTGREEKTGSWRS